MALVSDASDYVESRVSVVLGMDKVVGDRRLQLFGWKLEELCSEFQHNYRILQQTSLGPSFWLVEGRGPARDVIVMTNKRLLIYVLHEILYNLSGKALSLPAMSGVPLTVTASSGADSYQGSPRLDFFSAWTFCFTRGVDADAHVSKYIVAIWSSSRNNINAIGPVLLTQNVYQNTKTTSTTTELSGTYSHYL